MVTQNRFFRRKISRSKQMTYIDKKRLRFLLTYAAFSKFPDSFKFLKPDPISFLKPNPDSIKTPGPEQPGLKP